MLCMVWRFGVLAMGDRWWMLVVIVSPANNVHALTCVQHQLLGRLGYVRPSFRRGWGPLLVSESFFVAD